MLHLHSKATRCIMIALMNNTECLLVPANEHTLDNNTRSGLHLAHELDKYIHGQYMFDTYALAEL